MRLSLRNRIGRFEQMISRRFRLSEDVNEKIRRLEEIGKHAACLDRLISSDDWKALDERKQIYQRIREIKLRLLDITDQERRELAVEWNAIDSFFREIRQIVREGQRATETISKLRNPEREKKENLP